MLTFFRRLSVNNLSATENIEPDYYYPITEVDENNLVDTVKRIHDTVAENTGIIDEDEIWKKVHREYSIGIPPNVSQIVSNQVLTDDINKLNYGDD